MFMAISFGLMVRLWVSSRFLTYGNTYDFQLFMGFVLWFKNGSRGKDRKREITFWVDR